MLLSVKKLVPALAFDVSGSYTAVMLLGAAGFAVGVVLLLFLPLERR